MKPTICSGVIERKVIPYVRMTFKTKHMPRAKRYLKSQRQLALDLCLAASPDDLASTIKSTFRVDEHSLDGMFSQPVIDQPFRFGLVVAAAPVKSKSSPNHGQLPSNAGDYDNFVKAFLDAAQYCGLVPDDSLRWYRGPCLVEGYDQLSGFNVNDWQESGVELGDIWRFRYRFRLEGDQP